MQLNKSKKTVKYLSRDFAENRTALIQFLKQYFPTFLVDNNESSPHVALLEAVAYVSDALNFYSDINLQESLLYLADERKNLYNLAQSLGYKAKTVVPASVDLDVYQLVPSIGEGNNTKPDFKYALYIKDNMRVSTTDTDAVFFYTKDPVDFRFSSSLDPTTPTVYSVTDDGSVEYYLLKKRVKAVSGELQTRNFDFTEPKIYDKIVLPETNISEIIKITDSDANVWYDVPYLAQDLVEVPYRNLPYYDPVLSQYKSSVPFLLTYKQTEHRFVTRLRADETTEIQFGAGMSSEADEEIVPNPFNVGIGLNYFERAIDVSVDPLNFLYTRTYGTTPANTTLTVKYALTNGISDNVGANTITRIVESEVIDPIDTVNSVVLQTIKDSLSVNNPFGAFGGQDRKPLDTIREEAMANFAAQNRSVTRADYILRAYTMPAKYGAISKAYIEQDTQLGGYQGVPMPNPCALNLYVLSVDGNGNFVNANEAIKQNLKNYLSQYRLMTDAINLKDAYIVNIGVQCSIIVRPNENSNEVLLRVVDRLIQLFDNNKMEINGPIILANIISEVDRLEGVQSVQELKFSNLIDINAGYSGNAYPVENAIRNGILYPSVTPMIFEVKYKTRDISVRVVEM